ncbi:MAG: hypothetical protein ACRDPC_07815 [Solirubrobacteraceae bacterium]
MTRRCRLRSWSPPNNEQEGIAACIEALDHAAASYAGRCRLYLVDNASQDDTGAVAARAIAGCRALSGQVLLCPARDKSRALSVELADPSVLSMRQVSLVGGAVLSLQLAVIAALLLAHREFRALAAAPTYLLFRLFRAYVALETLLTLRLRASPARPVVRGRRGYLRARLSDAAPPDLQICGAHRTPAVFGAEGGVRSVL